MEELFALLLTYPGALIRWAFFKVFGSNKELKEYLKDQYTQNVLVGILAFIIVLMTIKLL
ncbi:MAG: hypothetical protein AAFZ15_02855 [Bacteroidota bacterium]